MALDCRPPSCVRVRVGELGPASAESGRERLGGRRHLLVDRDHAPPRGSGYVAASAKKQQHPGKQPVACCKVSDAAGSRKVIVHTCGHLPALEELLARQDAQLTHHQSCLAKDPWRVTLEALLVARSELGAPTELCSRWCAGGWCESRRHAAERWSWTHCCRRRRRQAGTRAYASTGSEQRHAPSDAPRAITVRSRSISRFLL